MEQGKVKWFNNTKGYGFLVSHDNTKDIFTHYSVIDMDGFRTLKAGQPVLFEAAEGPKGLQATHVRLLADNAADKHLATAGAMIPSALSD